MAAGHQGQEEAGWACLMPTGVAPPQDGGQKATTQEEPVVDWTAKKAQDEES